MEEKFQAKLYELPKSKIISYDDKGHDLLFDLIQAGLVEKVVE